MVRAEFKPPSDYTPDEGGSGKKKVWMFLGLGCGGILLIVGLAFALGAFRAVSCCSDLIDVGVRTMEAQAAVQDISHALHQGDMERAYGWTSSSYREGVSREKFNDIFRPHEHVIRTGYPILADMQAKGDSLDEVREIDYWVATVRFVPPAGQEVVIADFSIRWTGAEEKPVEIMHVQVEGRVRPLADEPAARAILSLQNLLRLGDLESSRRRLSMTSPLRGEDVSVLRAFVDEHKDVLLFRDIDILAVRYEGVDQAQVIGRADGHRLTVGVRAFGNDWRVETIEIVREVEPPEPEQEGVVQPEEEDELDEE
ncbi:MAG: hypothetical protein ACNA8W_01715 [Bradymonadaceae bacterium]